MLEQCQRSSTQEHFSLACTTQTAGTHQPWHDECSGVWSLIKVGPYLGLWDSYCTSRTLSRKLLLFLYFTGRTVARFVVHFCCSHSLHLQGILVQTVDVSNCTVNICEKLVLKLSKHKSAIVIHIWAHPMRKVFGCCQIKYIRFCKRYSDIFL